LLQQAEIQKKLCTAPLLTTTDGSDDKLIADE
jgi:hypothetical protein